MRALSKKEINRILAKGRMLLDQEITAILDEFQKKQPEIYQAIYGEPSDVIAEQNPEMANIRLINLICSHWVLLNRKSFTSPA